MSTSVAPATTTTWALDPAHTAVEFSSKHLMISTVKGRFADVTGSIVLDQDDITKSTVEATIATASIDTRTEQRDQHLRSADFLDVENFPAMTFTSTRVARDGDGFKVTGDLTIRGVTKEVTLDVTDEGRSPDPWGGQRAGFSATTKIDRRDFGLTYNMVLEAGGVMIGHDVKIAIEVEAVLKV